MSGRFVAIMALLFILFLAYQVLTHIGPLVGRISAATVRIDVPSVRGELP